MRFLLATIALLGLLQAASVRAGPAYTVTDLGTLGGSQSDGGRVNDRGYVLGTSLLPGDAVRRAFLWSVDTGKLELGTVTDPAHSQFVGDLNELNQVVGYELIDLVPRAFFYSDGAFRDLGGPRLPSRPIFGVNSSAAVGLNDSGTVVGGYATHAAIWRRGSLIDIGSLGGDAPEIASGALNVNNRGQVVGNSWTKVPGGTNNAFLYDEQSGFIDLGTFGGFHSAAYDINEASQVVGVSMLGDNISFAPFLWTESTGMVDLGTFGGNNGSAAAINEAGIIVGYSALADGLTRHAFRWTPGEGMVDLNLLIPEDSGWELLWAGDINNNGWIAGSGYIDGQIHAFLLTPRGLSLPSSLLLLIVGTCAGIRTRSVRLSKCGQSRMSPHEGENTFCKVVS